MDGGMSAFGADIPELSINVRFWGKSGHHLGKSGHH
jgi:hypothetical protein